jgi:hypothetical protein
LENRFGEPDSRFGATTLQRCFGEQLWEAASGSNIGILGSVFGTRLSVKILKSSFGGATVGSNFAALKAALTALKAALTDSCFEKRYLWEIVLESNFEKPLSETAFGNNF